ncbi:MAG: 4-amino-4-deoxy-L-arabinose transferase-like glycosyltransferase [Planctomycetota bacterium]
MRVPLIFKVLFLCVAIAAVVPRVSFIKRTSPYPLQTDEALIMKRAAGMVERGDLSPHFFKYPTLPIYLTALAFATNQAQDEEGNAVIGRVSKPFYTYPEVPESARFLFAALSVLTVMLTGILAVRAFREPALLFIAPLLLLVSDRFLLQSWMYLNVDIIGAVVCLSAITTLFFTRERTNFWYRALLPGLFVGFAVGSKYYLGLVGLPFAIVLFDREQREHLTRNAIGIVLATIVAFLVTTPYALIDRDLFLTQVIFEIDHYSEGHVGGEGEPGIEQFLYYGGQLIKEFGVGGLGLMLYGLVIMWKRDRKAAILFLAFPVVLLLFLCTQRVHFPRNLTSIYALAPIAAGMGIVSLAGARIRTSEQAWKRLMGPLVLIAVLVFGLPWQRVWTSYSVQIDSRKLALTWVEENVERDLKVYIADELQMDVSPFKLTEFEGTRIRLIEKPLSDFVVPEMNQVYAGQAVFFIVPELVPGTRFARSFGEQMKPLEQLTTVAEFGRNQVPRVTTRLIHMGNPRLQIFGLSTSEGDEQ